MHRAVSVVLLVFCLGLALASPGRAAGPATLLADINQSVDSNTAGVQAGPLVPVGNRLLFLGYEPSSGSELWVSDGSPVGGRLLKDVTPGPESSNFRWLGTVRQTAVFVRTVDFNEIELWRSDGTEAGTFRIAEASSGPVELCGDGWPTAVGNQLLFVAAKPTFECGLWKTDGTAAGTVRVKPLEQDVWALVPLGNRVVFATDGALWTSDGTAAGTAVLRRFATGEREGPWGLTAAGSRAAFIAQDTAGGGEELWSTDGTSAGTRPLTRFFEPLPFGQSEGASVQAIGSFLYFTANDGTGWDWWRSDGSGASPQRVTDFVNATPFGNLRQILQLGSRLIFPASETNVGSGLWSSSGTPQSAARITGCPDGCPTSVGTGLAQVGERAVFLAFDTVHGTQLWSTDGTGAGTLRITDFLCGGGSCFDATPRLFRFGGKVFFFDLFNRRRALWKTDGTAKGTVRVADLGMDVLVSFESLAEAGGKLYFLVKPPQRGSQIWVSDGTAPGTRLLEHIVGAGGRGSSPFDLSPLRGGLLFGAFEGDGPRLWRSDGTPAGTSHVAGAHLPYRAIEIGNGLGWFIQDGAGSEHQLWRTDGTDAGTFRLTPDGVGSVVNGITVGNRLRFLVAQPGNGSRMTFWESDGTVAGTHALGDLPAEAGLPQSFRGLGGRLYFLANESETGVDQLWTSDGTVTVPLTHFEGYAFLDGPLEMALAGSTVFFRAQGGIWKTDGTAAGTVQVPFQGFNASDLVAFHGALFFLAELEDQTRALFRSDGTGAGTVQVQVVDSSFASDVPFELTVAGDRLFFAAGDLEHGRELWTSDGTPEGTRRVRDILPGPGSSSPSSLVADGNRVFFASTDGTSGFEIWTSDGTAAGTRRVQDLAPGPLSSNPKELAVSGNRLFFVADDGLHGEEPWVYPLTGGGCAPSAEVLCLGGRFQVEADWRDFEGNRGAGHAVALTADTGYFWFFDAANVEVILKVLDGRSSNGHQWVFYGALSNVEYSLTVTDTETGAARRYTNPPGRLGSVADTEAFGPRGAHEAGVVTQGPAPSFGDAIVSARTAAVTGSCVAGPNRLCLQDGRFAVEARWKKRDGTSGAGRAVPLGGGDTGYFWFFDASNVEVVLKVLDGRPLNGKFWVFYGALSDVEYTITVTDTETGAVKTYTNPQGRLASVADTGAF